MPDEHAAVTSRAARVRYDDVCAIDGIDLSVRSGECVALLGASGSGKSTLLHAIAGLVPLAGGEIWLADQCVATARVHEPPERRNVGLVFQDFALWPHLTAVETVAYPLRRASRSRRDAETVAHQLLEQLGIAQFADRRPAELSGGQRQRVGLARALARSPAVFLLDEPTAHLDTHLRAAFQSTVRDRRTDTGAPVLYATHDAGEALALADRVAVLVDGRLVQIAAPAVAYAEPVSAAAATLTGPCTLLSALVGAASDAELVLDLGGGAMTVAGGGAPDRDLVPAQLVLRPDWVALDGPLPGRVHAVAFRGTHTDYLLDTSWGDVELQLPGSPRLAPGEPVSWRIERAWALPQTDASDRMLNPTR